MVTIGAIGFDNKKWSEESAMTTTNTNRLADATRPTRISANECIPRYIRLVQTRVHHIKATAAHNAKGYCNKKKIQN